MRRMTAAAVAVDLIEVEDADDANGAILVRF